MQSQTLEWPGMLNWKMFMRGKQRYEAMGTLGAYRGHLRT